MRGQSSRSDSINLDDYKEVKPRDTNKPRDQATGKKIFNMLLESKAENCRLLDTIKKREEDSRRKEFLQKLLDHLSSQYTIQWKNVGCDAWGVQSDLNKIRDLSIEATTEVKDGKQKNEQHMHDLFLVSNNNVSQNSNSNNNGSQIALAATM